MDLTTALLNLHNIQPSHSRRASTGFNSRKIGRRQISSKPAPPAWEPETLVDLGESAAAAALGQQQQSAPDWNEEDERLLRGKIREAMEKIEGISSCLEHGKRGGETNSSSVGGGDGSSGGRRVGGGGGGGDAAAIATSSGRDRRGGRNRSAATREDDGSIEGLHGSLKLSLELVTSGEKHASANTTAMADMSEWLSNLEQKQLVRIKKKKNARHTIIEPNHCAKDFKSKATPGRGRFLVVSLPPSGLWLKQLNYAV